MRLRLGSVFFSYLALVIILVRLTLGGDILYVNILTASRAFTGINLSVLAWVVEFDRAVLS
jgi:hypothetical protein